MEYQILLVEDDAQIREIIMDYFNNRREYKTEFVCACDGEEGMERIYERQYDLILLDIMLPGIDGFQLCKALRKSSITPVIFLTARGEEEDKLYGYKLGCDDYIVKPFSLAELYAKVQALLKRSKGTVISPNICVGQIVLNPSGGSAETDGRQVRLAPKEFAILKYLMEHKNLVVTREELLIHIWGYDYEGNERVVDNHVKKLRKSLGISGAQIKTVVTKGYKMEEEKIEGAQKKY